jgi:hypothetical protein
MQGRSPIHGCLSNAAADGSIESLAERVCVCVIIMRLMPLAAVWLFLAAVLFCVTTKTQRPVRGGALNYAHES